MEKYSVDSDPRGLIFEAYRIDGITDADCRSIFFDWALGLNPKLNPIEEISALYNIYAKHNPNHPMNSVLEEGLLNFNKKSARVRRRKT